MEEVFWHPIVLTIAGVVFMFVAVHQKKVGLAILASGLAWMAVGMSMSVQGIDVYFQNMSDFLGFSSHSRDRY